MRAVATLILLFAGTPLLGGCALAVLPVIAAGGAIGKQQIDKNEPPRQAPERAASAPNLAEAAAGQVSEELTAPKSADAIHTTAADPVRLPTPPAPEDPPGIVAPADPAPTTAPSQLDANAIAPAYVPMLDFVTAQIEKQRAGILPSSVVPVRDVSLTDPQYAPCAGNPNAVVIDIDPEGGLTLDAVAAPVNGLLLALSEIRKQGVKIIWISGEQQSDYTSLRSKLETAGLVPDGEDEILFPVSRKSRKQLLRQEAASRYCVLAMAGDKRADFDELYDYLIDPGSAVMLERNFRSGWFIVPAPLRVEQRFEEKGNADVVGK